jgi:hypothetical protein
MREGSIEEIMKMDQKTRQGRKWFELMKLVQRCPSTVNGITIMGTTRLILWCLAYHADSETASTTVNSYILTKEVGCSHRTLDRALHDLIFAGLVSQPARFDQIRIVGSNSRTINRELLEKEIATAADVAGLGDLGGQGYAGFYGPVFDGRLSTPLDIESETPISNLRGELRKQLEGKWHEALTVRDCPVLSQLGSDPRRRTLQAIAMEKQIDATLIAF